MHKLRHLLFNNSKVINIIYINNVYNVYLENKLFILCNNTLSTSLFKTLYMGQIVLLKLFTHPNVSRPLSILKHSDLVHDP